MANAAKDGDTVIIKKYANRRLYNTRTSSYITLDHLAQMVKENIEFKVLDAKTGADLTHTILTQIIMEEEASGEQMLPTNFLRQLIAMYGNSMQALLPSYLEASMEHFRENQVKLRKAIEDSIGANPLAQIAQRNMELFKAATAAFVPRRRSLRPRPPRMNWPRCAARWRTCRRSWISSPAENGRATS
jgi:polyhydroxyalkanoate synthesis repressor PhaR